MLVTVLTPTKNSASLIQRHYEEVKVVLGSKGWDHEILYVDDGSGDSSQSLIESLSQSDPAVRGVFLSRSYGQQTAISVGLLESRGDVNVTLDADLEVPASTIPLLVEEVMRGHDYVPVCRTQAAARGGVRRLGSLFFHHYLRVRTGLPIRDFGCGAAASSKGLLQRMRESQIPYIGLKHLAGQLADSIHNFPVKNVQKPNAKSSYNFPRLLRAFLLEHRVKVGLNMPPNEPVATTCQRAG